MKIAFAGAACVGKTTLAKALAEIWNVPYIPEPMEFVPWNSSLSYERWLHEKQMKNECQAGDSFVADSSMWVRLAGLLYYFSSAEDSHLQEIWDRSYKAAQNYDHVFYLPPVLPMEDDKRRPTGLFQQKTFDLILSGLLQDFEDNNVGPPEIYPIKEETVDQRIAFVRHMVGK